MILHNNIPRCLSPLGLVAACVLVLFALRSWSAAKLVSFDPENEFTAIAADPTSEGRPVVSPSDDDDSKGEKALKRQAEKDDGDDADDNDNTNKATARAEAEAKTAQMRAAFLSAKADVLAKIAKACTAEAKRQNPARDRSAIEKETETKIDAGANFEKQMEQLGEKIGKEMEAKFGPDLKKQMEQLGEKIGKEMEAKLGPGSEFAKKMEAFGKEMEAKFGPGSDFEKKMKGLGDEIHQKYGPWLDFAKKVQEQAVHPDSDAKAGAKTKTKDRVRERRLHELKAQIAKLMAEIESLKGSRDGTKP